METLMTSSNITFAIGILAAIFGVYSYFKNPQIKSDKTDALIGQQLKFIQESNDRRFAEVHDEIKAVVATNQNHVHTIDTKVEVLTNSVTQLGKDVVRLATIIEERIPSRNGIMKS